MTDIIDRESSSLIKGPRLQKLRTAEMLFDAILDGGINVYGAIEKFDDSIIRNYDDEEPSAYNEQNKEYSSDFSLNSVEIKKAVCSFLDQWIQFYQDPNMRFAYYATSGYKCEGTSEIIKRNNFVLPSEPILLKLQNYKYDDCLEIIKAMIIDYYKKAYKESKKKGYVDIIEGFTDEEWRKFLNRIIWKFNQMGYDDLENVLLDKLKRVAVELEVELLNIQDVLGAILDEIEKISLKDGFLKSAVHVATVKVKILQSNLLMKNDSRIDPYYEKWDSLEKENQFNLKRKFLSANPNYNKDDIEEHEEDAYEAIFSLKKVPEQRQAKAYMYRVFIKANRRLRRLRKENDNELSVDTIKKVIGEIVEETNDYIKDLSQTYKIPFKDKTMVKNTLFCLFEECYISFKG